MNIIERVWTMIFKSRDLVPLSDIVDAEERIALWDSVFKGEPDWLKYQFVNLYGRKAERTRKSIKPAKLLTHELSSLIWSEMPELSVDESISDILDNNSFYENIPKKSERMMALGGMAIKIYVENNEPKLDYVPAHRFIPISWDNREIYEADFIDRFVKDEKSYIRVESHRKVDYSTEEGEIVKGYQITNKVYERINTKMMKPVQLSAVLPDYQENVVIETDQPLFVYVSNPEENNLHVDSPLGISLYANALDTIESLDIAFDALQSEIVLGRKRIIVPASAVRSTFVNENGETKQVKYFDPSDEVFQAFDLNDAEGQKIIDNTVSLRVDEIRLAIQTLLDILSVQVGFSAGYLSFDGGSGVKTATEVVSDNSKTFKTKKFWEDSIGSGILQLCESLRAIAPLYNIPVSDMEYTIEWNDSVIEDRNSRADYLDTRYTNGTMSLKEVIQKRDGLSDEKAKAKAEEIKAERATIDVGSMFGGME